MKPVNGFGVSQTVLVALFTSAWIETVKVWCMSPVWPVALFTSAWIETRYWLRWFNRWRVALFTSAWIETPLISD